MRNALTTLLVLGAVLRSEPVRAATVTTTADSGPGSLRVAIDFAAAGEFIDFAVGGAITLTSGELVIDTDLNLTGPGADNLVIQRSTDGATPDFRVFNVLEGTVRISGLTVSNGRDTVGGGIFNQSDLTLRDCVLTGNVAAAAGGGLMNQGSMTVSNCVFRGNSVTGAAREGFGGGLYNDGAMLVINSLISSNSVTSGTGDRFGGGIYNYGTLTLNGLVVQGNSVAADADNGAGYGGGLDSESGTVYVDNSTFSGNVALGGAGGGGGFGGGLNNGFGSVYLATSAVSGNVARGGAGNAGGLGQGGGVANGFGIVALDRSTVSGNLAVGGEGEGGGIANIAGTVYVDNSTVSGNTSVAGPGSGGGAARGGGIFNDFGAVELAYSTVASNSVPGGFPEDGGGIFNLEGAVRLQSTIVAANTATVDSFNGEFGDILSGGFNLIGSMRGPFTPAPGDQTSVAAAALHLGPLQDNGGPTFTHALLCGSPAIDAGQNLDAPPTDQRGFPRVVNGVIDIGAFEADNTPPTIACPGAITLECSPAGGATGTVSVNVADADGDSLVVVWTVDGPVVQTNVVAAGGPPTATRVDLTANFASGSHVITVTVIDSEGCSASCSTTLTVAFRGDLYPIALSIRTLAGARVGSILPDIYNGVEPGNFGWLTWAGSPSEPTLATSLRPPGNSETYTNPNDPEDHLVSVGDWAQGSPGISNSRQVRTALDALKQIDITVPVWDQARGTGNNSLYRVTAYARVRLISYQLPWQNRITARFLGFVDCP